MLRRACLLLAASAADASYVGAVNAPMRAPRTSVVMKASKGPFPLPQPPVDFDGAQWAPTTFLPFPINVQPAAAAIKEVLDAAPEVVAPAEPSATEAAPAPAPPAAADPNKSTFTVTMRTPDGDKVFECPPDMYMLDQTEEVDNADDFADLPFACRAGSCSACTGKVVSGTVDSSDCAFLDDSQKSEGFVLTCTARPTSDCIIETHKEDDLY